jgi:GNAT superfamily N-acetyltransferase
MLIRQVEESSLNAWPALQQILFDGWILRFARGYTKRANSVSGLFPSSIDVHQKIETCERIYRQRGLPVIFRLTPFSSPPDLDQILAGRHYQKIEPTLVLHLNLRDSMAPLLPSERLPDQELEEWLDIYYKFGASAPDKRQTHKDILQAIPSQRYLASLTVSGRAIACGMGVLERNFVGLFDLVTDPQHRNQGYGTKLVSAILSWAVENGATEAYLQVVKDNAPAQRLYARLGFQEVYRYWYRVYN